MTNKLKTVCIVMPCHWTHNMGGAEYQVKILIDRMIKRGGFDIHFITRHVGVNYKPEGYVIHIITPPFNVRRGSFFLDYFALKKLIHKIKPETIYQRTGTGHTGLLANLAKNNDIKFIWHIAHNYDVSPFRFKITKKILFIYIDKKIEEYGIKNTKYIIAQTEDQGVLLKNNYNRNIFKMIRNYHPLPGYKTKKYNKIRVVWLANLKPIKRPELFLQLAKKLSNIKNVEFILIGKKQYKQKWIEQFLSEIEKTNNTNYMGYLKQDDVNKLLDNSHVLVNTSIEEGFSNTFIQAWMRKMPVISLNVNPDNLITKYNLGMCSGNVSQLIKDVETVIRDKKLRNKLSENAYEYAVNYHNMNEAEKLIDVF